MILLELKKRVEIDKSLIVADVLSFVAPSDLYQVRVPCSTLEGFYFWKICDCFPLFWCVRRCTRSTMTTPSH
jgi:hypothetical protein